ncbi:MAG: YhjD/YihY/BrkB family envelope integrity protein [Acidobacteriota bacterium]
MQTAVRTRPGSRILRRGVPGFGSVLRRLRIFIEALSYVFGREGTGFVSAITFNFFLSVFPIIVLLLSIAGYLGLGGLRESVFQALGGFFPISQDFIIRNLRIYTRRVGEPQVVSLLLITWTGSAFFFSLEAALYSAFRLGRRRRFLSSQLLGIGMAVWAGALILLCILLLGWGDQWLESRAISRAWVHDGLGYGLSFLLAYLLFVNVYLLLPSARQPLSRTLTTSFFASLVWLGVNEFFRRLAASWSLEVIYGPFFVSITILFWAYATGCILIGFARLSADGFFGD